MENASKALLIAGAVLIAILLIGVAMLIYQGAMGGINSGIASMGQQEIQAFNAPFTQYEGTQRGTNVRAIIQNIISSNSANQAEDGKLVSLDILGEAINASTDELNTNKMSASKSKINTGKTYEVVLEYEKSGLVNKVVIKEQGKS